MRSIFLRNFFDKKEYYLLLSYLVPIVALVVMIWGNITQAIGGGLGCPDWPLCHGQIIPFSAPNTPIEHLIGEYGHRIITLIFALLVICVGIFSYKFRNESPRIFYVLIALSFLLLIQILVGGLVIITQLTNVVIGAIHLVLGLSIFGLGIIHLIWIKNDLFNDK